MQDLRFILPLYLRKRQGQMETAPSSLNPSLPGYYRTVGSFYIENFGCRATQADGAAIEHQFQQRGFTRSDDLTRAQVAVINSCTVTAAADQDARAAVRRIRRQNPGCEIIVTGCYAQRAPEEVAVLPGVTRVIGNSHKHQLAELALIEPNHQAFFPLSQLAVQAPISVSDIFAHTELLAAPVFDVGTSSDRTRPNLKVQDGCDNRCSFCVIPFVRGNSRSLTLEKVLAEVGALVNAGYREVVISGINLGRWGRDLARPLRFEDLVREILCQTDLEKLRLSSIEPMDWSDELVGMMAGTRRIAKHAHVPLQSGSDRVLRAMHRKYRPWHYREKIEKIRAAISTAAIGADVMVGFPGESEADFAETRRLIEDLPFTYLHVFTYSSRPGTSAAMRDQIPVHIARERNRVLREIAAEKKLSFMRSLVGQTVEAITLNIVRRGPEGELTEALTDNYQKTFLPGVYGPNHWLTIRVEQADSKGITGLVEDHAA